jgi:hypothetical protein
MNSLSYGLAFVVLGLAACGDSGGGGGAGSTSSSTSPASGSSTTTSTTTSTSTGSSGCTEITVPKLALITPKPADGDYDYGATTNAIGGAADDHLVLDLFNGLDSPTVTIASDAKNNNPGTCEACGWVFEDGSGTTAGKIFFQQSGTITLDVPNFGNQLSAQPNSVTLSDVTYREVMLTDATDLYSAQLVPEGACVHVTAASTN